MKKIILFFMMAIALSSCSTYSGVSYNANENQTQVVLSENNYKVVKKVSAESKAFYIFGIGPNSKKAMISEARTKMLEGAELEGKARAVIKENVEYHYRLFPFVGVATVTVSGYLIEFIH